MEHRSVRPPIDSAENRRVRSPPTLVLTEGVHDIEFLQRISSVLAKHDSAIPNLRALETQQQIVMLPLGGNGPQAWVHHLISLGKSAFLLFDRESSLEGDVRRRAIESFNLCSRRRAFITSKRSIENYLHRQAIFDASGVSVDFCDQDHVADIVACKSLIDKGVRRPLGLLSARTRKRIRNRAKHWLNRDAVSCMTPERLAQRDPAGEVIGWLHCIGELAAMPT